MSSTYPRQELPSVRLRSPVAPAHDRGNECTQALCGEQGGHIHSCKRFAASQEVPGHGQAEESAPVQLYLSETGASICNRNRIMMGLRFLFR